MKPHSGRQGFVEQVAKTVSFSGGPSRLLLRRMPYSARICFVVKFALLNAAPCPAVVTHEPNIGLNLVELGKLDIGLFFRASCSSVIFSLSLSWFIHEETTGEMNAFPKLSAPLDFSRKPR